MLFWLWSSTLAQGTCSWNIKFLFGAIPMKLLPTKDLRKQANDAMVDAIRWDMETLLSGKFPSLDQCGLPLPGPRLRKAGGWIAPTAQGDGWRLGFDAWCGDWKERALSHNYVGRNYQSTRVCDACDAIQIFARTPRRLWNLSYTNFDLDAPWQFTRVSHEQYLDRTPEPLRSPWCKVPGFKSTRVQWEPMHVILMGVAKDIAASILCDIDAWTTLFFCAQRLRELNFH